VASKTPFHLERIFLINSGHIVDLPMAGRAANAFCYVNAVVKVGKLRNVVNAFPFDGLVVAEAGPDGLKIRAVCPDLAVSVHTRLGRRQTGRRRRLNRGVTVAAIDTVIANVVLMAELDRLLLLHVTTRQV